MPRPCDKWPVRVSHGLRELFLPRSTRHTLVRASRAAVGRGGIESRECAGAGRGGHAAAAAFAIHRSNEAIAQSDAFAQLRAVAERARAEELPAPGSTALSRPRRAVVVRRAGDRSQRSDDGPARHSGRDGRIFHRRLAHGPARRNRLVHASHHIGRPATHRGRAVCTVDCRAERSNARLAAHRGGIAQPRVNGDRRDGPGSCPCHGDRAHSRSARPGGRDAQLPGATRWGNRAVRRAHCRLAGTIRPR